jgi:outer membrane protein assembly factor BamB
MMQRGRRPAQRDAPGPSPAPHWRWPAVAGAAALLVAAVGCTSSATTTSPAPVSPTTVSPTTVSPTTVSPTTVSPSAASSASASSASASSAAADWPAYDRTAERSGVSVSSPALVAVRHSWTASVDGAVYAQPLVVGSEVIVATENDSVYALSASDGAVIWTRHLASPVPAGLPCGNINPSGITGTPVADPATGRLWVVTFTAQPTYRHTLWELDLATGQTDWQRPIDVSGSDPRAQQQRGALTLLGSRVYVPFGGLDGDCSDYKGRVVGAPVSGSGPVVSFTTANQRQAGIWAPAGESVRDGSLYVATGNGMPYNQVDDSDSVLRLSPGLAVQGRFTPANFVALSSGDLDLGSTAPALLPDGLVFQVGKQGIGYVLDGSRLGGTGGELGSSDLCEGGFGGDAVDGSTVVFSCYTSLRAIEVTPAAGIHILWSVTSYAAGPPIIAGGVVWDVSRAGLLSGFRLSDGKSVFSTTTAPVVTDFPSLSASGSRLIVPEGDKVVSYLGI